MYEYTCTLGCQDIVLCVLKPNNRKLNKKRIRTIDHQDVQLPKRTCTNDMREYLAVQGNYQDSNHLNSNCFSEGMIQQGNYQDSNPLNNCCEQGKYQDSNPLSLDNNYCEQSLAVQANCQDSNPQESYFNNNSEDMTECLADSNPQVGYVNYSCEGMMPSTAPSDSLAVVQQNGFQHSEEDLIDLSELFHDQPKDLDFIDNLMDRYTIEI